jgi:hypothetical protein
LRSDKALYYFFFSHTYLLMFVVVVACKTGSELGRIEACT